MNTILKETNDRFAATDKAWGVALDLIFGAAACEARYDGRGRGKPGSTLRQIYDARSIAQADWERAHRLGAFAS